MVRRMNMLVSFQGRMSTLFRSVVKLGLLCAVVVALLLCLKVIMIFVEIKGGSPDLSNNLAALRKHGIVSNLTGVNLERLDLDELVLTMHTYLDNIEVICKRKIRMGNLGDGGWEICDDPIVQPQRPCIVYSFGINYDFSFDDDVARLYGCHVYSFDPSMNRMSTGNRSDHVHFFKIGLGRQTITDERGWDLYTLSDIRSRLGHQNTVIDLIKMDIEDSEWDVIPQIVSSGQLANVRQLLLEYHVRHASHQYLLSRLKSIQAIEELGFKKFYVHKNVHCETLLPQFPVPRTECYEVHYLRENLTGRGACCISTFQPDPFDFIDNHKILASSGFMYFSTEFKDGCNSGTTVTCYKKATC